MQKAGAGVAGLRGVAGSFFSSIAGQVNKTLGNLVSLGITDIPKTVLDDLRKEGVALLAAVVTSITNEGGKVTDTERELSKEVAPLQSPFSAFSEVTAGLRALTVLSEVAKVKSLFLATGKFKKSFFTPELKPKRNVAKEAIKRFQRMGFTEDQAFRATQRMIDLERQLLEVDIPR